MGFCANPVSNWFSTIASPVKPTITLPCIYDTIRACSLKFLIIIFLAYQRNRFLNIFFCFIFPPCALCWRDQNDIWPVIIHNLKKSCCHRTVVILQRYKKYMKSWGMRKPWQCHKCALFIWFKRSLLRHIRSYYKGAVLIRYYNTSNLIIFEALDDIII